MLQPWITGPRLANLEGLLHFQINSSKKQMFEERRSLHFQIKKPSEIWKGKENVEALTKEEKLHFQIKMLIADADLASVLL